MATQRLDLPISGMHCAGCAGRIEKALQDLAGVQQAQVNFATEKRPCISTRWRWIAPPSAARSRTSAILFSTPTLTTPSTTSAWRGRQKSATSAVNSPSAWRSVCPSCSAPCLPCFPGRLTGCGNRTCSSPFTTPVQFWVGWSFYQGTWAALKQKSADMSTLIALGTSAAYLYSAAVTFLPQAFSRLGVGTHVYFDTAVMILTLIILGRLLEARARGQTSEAIRKLMGLQARTARVWRGGETVDIPVADVTIGDLVLVRPGEKVPVDGDITEVAQRSTSQCSPARACRWTRAPAILSSALRSTRPAASPCAPRGWGATPCWPRSSGWLRRRRAPRRPSSDWPTRSRAFSCRRCSPSPC